MNQAAAKADELFFVVDEHDQPLEPLPRKLVHGYGVWHRVSHVWIVDGDNILCQQRALTKELNPGYWESFFGGHNRPDESYEDAALRELHEELRITASSDDLHVWKIFRFADPNGNNNEFDAVFVIHWSGAVSGIQLLDNEVAQIAWRPINEVIQAIQKGEALWTKGLYELGLLKDIKERKI